MLGGFDGELSDLSATAVGSAGRTRRSGCGRGFMVFGAGECHKKINADKGIGAVSSGCGTTSITMGLSQDPGRSNQSLLMRILVSSLPVSPAGIETKMWWKDPCILPPRESTSDSEMT